GGPLRAQPAARDRGVGAALDLDDPSVLVEDTLRAADRAVRADAVRDPVGRRGARDRAAGGRRGDGAAAPRRIRPAQLPEDRPVQERETCHTRMLPATAAAARGPDPGLRSEPRTTQGAMIPGRGSSAGRDSSPGSGTGAGRGPGSGNAGTGALIGPQISEGSGRSMSGSSMSGSGMVGIGAPIGPQISEGSGSSMSGSRSGRLGSDRIPGRPGR